MKSITSCKKSLTILKGLKGRIYRIDRQCNGQEKKCKRTNSDLQNITQKTKD